MHSFDRTMLASLGFSDPDKGDPTHDLACQYLAIPEIQLKVGQLFSRDRLYCHAEVDEYLDHLRASTEPDYSFTDDNEAYSRQLLSRSRPVLEHVISKGDGKYKTTVGFVDLQLRYARKVEQPFRVDEKVGTFLFTDDDCYDEHREAAAAAGMDYTEFLEASKKAPVLEAAGKSERDRILIRHRYSAYLALCQHRAYTVIHHDYVRRRWDWFVLNVEVKTNPVPIGNVLRQVKLYAEYVEGKWLLATTYPLGASDVSALNSCGIGHVQLGDRFAAWAAERRANDQTQEPVSTFVL